MTPHNEAEKEDIASIVIMPGDPKRAKFIADNYLDDCKLVNSVRNIYAYTGFYKNKKITVMASGMGMPSMGIYSYELYNFYDVDTIIRVGSIGAYREELNLFDIIMATEAYTDSTYGEIASGLKEHVLESSPDVNDKIRKVAHDKNVELHEGRIYCSDCFYMKDEKILYRSIALNCLGVEMESFALFHNAKISGKKAACIATVSDHRVKDTEGITAEEREKSMVKMIELALDVVLEM